MRTPENRKKVLIVDDHPLTRKGLFDAIAETDDLEVCGEASGIREAYDSVARQPPDIIVLDLNLKDGNGWDFLKRLQTEHVNVPVLVVSVCNEEVYAARLLQSGASGYLMKDAPIDQVVEALRKILNGHIAVSDVIASRLIRTTTRTNGTTETVSELDRLSDRELQVLDFLRQGKGNIEIACYLGISQKTIGTYKARLMEKFGVRTTPELLEYLQNAPSSGDDAPQSAGHH